MIEETEKLRIIGEFGRNNILFAERRNPYGFWYFKYDFGAPSDEMKAQVFTTYEEAEKAGKAFLKIKNKHKE